MAKFHGAKVHIFYDITRIFLQRPGILFFKMRKNSHTFAEPQGLKVFATDDKGRFENQDKPVHFLWII